MAAKPSFERTPLEELGKIHAELFESFNTGFMYSLAKRKHELAAYARMLSENAEQFAQALSADVNRPYYQSLMFEVSVVHSAIATINELDEWVKLDVPKVNPRYESYKPVLYKMPKGVVLILSPWNWPLILTSWSVIAAIAAGNCVVVKPSELVPRLATLMAELVPKYMDPQVIRVVKGGVEEATRLLDLKWSHIHYTGNGRVGRVVAAAAAKHLTPVSLELGGKSPVVIDPEGFDAILAGRRLLYGKVTNAGQTCVAPEYILCPESIQPALIKGMEQALKEFFPSSGGQAFQHEEFGRAGNERQFKKVQDLLAKSHGEVVLGQKQSDPSNLAVAPVVVKTDGNDSLMTEELFAPVFPLISVEDIDDAIRFINERDHPLSLYVFTQSDEVKNKFIARTQSGSLVFNDVCEQLSTELPLGGFGESGYGRTKGKFGFDEFTHLRASMEVPAAAEPFLQFRYPPYTSEKLAFAQQFVHPEIPDW